MSKRLIFLGGLLIGIAAVSCNTSSNTDAKLNEAAQMYREALAIEKNAEPVLEELIQKRNSLSVQGRALSQEEQNFIDEVYALEEQFNEWKESRVVMPADKEAVSKRSSAEWLRIQRQYKDSITAIHEELVRLKSRN